MAGLPGPADRKSELVEEREGAQGAREEVVEQWVVAARLPPPAAACNLKAAPWPGACGPLPEGRVGRLMLGVPVGGGKFGP